MKAQIEVFNEGVNEYAKLNQIINKLMKSRGHFIKSILKQLYLLVKQLTLHCPNFKVLKFITMKAQIGSALPAADKSAKCLMKGLMNT